LGHRRVWSGWRAATICETMILLIKSITYIGQKDELIRKVPIFPAPLTQNHRETPGIS
jgi:hypothetical protein